jgi:prevent-host-death family protein
MTRAVWTVAKAKAQFSELVQRAAIDGPQTITRNGRKAAIVVAPEDWERKTARAGTLADFFLKSPLAGSGLKIKRRKDRPRKIEL